MSASPEHAMANWPCPLARTFAKTHENCIADACPLWRWSTGAAWRDAVVREANRIGDKAPFAKASAAVALDPKEHGCHGRCGLGGPE